jgi:hypothetical protein
LRRCRVRSRPHERSLSHRFCAIRPARFGHLTYAHGCLRNRHHGRQGDRRIWGKHQRHDLLEVLQQRGHHEGGFIVDHDHEHDHDEHHHVVVVDRHIDNDIVQLRGSRGRLRELLDAPSL